eukprot:TRINITY_DN84952_c0_g1_i1.p1 TRINITY_DN84952_c0_g1~~TRINITY_DN84952_c0_g1_i1.p1  ORF type:complete len:502 (-),score=42.17 TRINITY_DN84952_c0_g1_i1:38-1543(-)
MSDDVTTETASTEWEDGEEEMFYRDETMNSIILATGGQLKEVNVEQEEWFQQALRDQEAFLNVEQEAGEDDEINPLEVAKELSELEEEPFRREESGVDEEWILLQVVSRKRHKGVTYYLCQWKGYLSQPTWETEEDLADEGWAPLIEQFLKDRQTSNSSHQLTAEERERQSARDSALLAHGRQAYHPFNGQVGAPRAPPCPPGEFNPEVFWPDFMTRITGEMNKTYNGVVYVQNIVNPMIRRTFTKHWLTGGVGVPVMVFHGSSERNIPGIIQHGLVIPGSRPGVRVENGSAHGLGIYTSRTPATPTGYCNGGNYMFCCAVLVGGKFCTTTVTPGEWIVMMNPEQVLPCFLIQWGYPQGNYYTDADDAYPTQKTVPQYTNQLYKGTEALWGVRKPYESSLLQWATCKAEKYDPKKCYVWTPSTGNCSRPPPIPPQVIKRVQKDDAQRNHASNQEKHYPKAIPEKPPAWEKTIYHVTKKQLRGQAKRVKDLYRSGAVRQKGK